MNRHTGATRATVASLLTLAVLQLWWSDVSGAAAGRADLTTTLPVALTLLAAVALARVSCFETRLVVVLACLTQLAGLALALAVGLPGSTRQTLDAQAGEALLLLALPLALLAIDRRTRRAGATVTRALSPYAR